MKTYRRWASGPVGLADIEEEIEILQHLRRQRLRLQTRGDAPVRRRCRRRIRRRRIRAIVGNLGRAARGSIARQLSRRGDPADPARMAMAVRRCGADDWPADVRRLHQARHRRGTSWTVLSQHAGITGAAGAERHRRLGDRRSSRPRCGRKAAPASSVGLNLRASAPAVLRQSSCAARHVATRIAASDKDRRRSEVGQSQKPKDGHDSRKARNRCDYSERNTACPVSGQVCLAAVVNQPTA